MTKAKIYTVRQAVFDTINSYEWNVLFKSTDFFRTCRSNLIKNNNPAVPFDGTLHREMRRIRKEFGIVCVDYKKSIYMKKDDNERKS